MMRKFLVSVGIAVLLCVLTVTSFLDSVNQVLAAHKTRSIKSQKYAMVREIRYWSGATHTRIVIDLDKEVAYKDQLLNKDIALDKPPRLFIDLTAAKLSPHHKSPYPSRPDYSNKSEPDNIPLIPCASCWIW